MSEPLAELRVFIEVGRVGGFRAAAKSLGQSPGSVSQTVRRLEDRIGARLFERTTRQVSLTRVGRRLFDRCEPLVADVETALRDVAPEGGDVTGLLRLSAPTAVGPLFLDELVGRFLLAYPKVRVALSYEDRKVDMIDEGLDAAVRSANLMAEDSFMLAVGPKVSMAVVVSPDYLEDRGPFRKPADLTRADGLRFRFTHSGLLAPWSFEGSEGPYEVEPQTRVIVDSTIALVELAAAGVGVAYTYAHQAQALLDAGRLVSLFPRSLPKRPRFAINTLSRRHRPARLKAFLEMAKTVPRK
ncbi:MAG: LysR family transcriptional regulator [Acidobacteriota bacterium]